MNTLDELIREVIRDEVRRLIRPDVFDAPEPLSESDVELKRKAQEVATRFRRARNG